MKKIIISNYDDLKNPYFGGGGAYVIHEIAKRLISEFDITVVTGKYPGCKNEIVDGVEYRRVGASYAGPKLGQIIYYFTLYFYFMFNKFDLWMENFTPPFSTNFLQLFTKKPVIGLVYMLVGEDMKRKYKLPFDWIEKIGIKTYKYFIVPTNYAKDKISSINPDADVKFMPNGINLKYSKNRNSIRRNILYMGRIDINQKGLDLLLNAYNSIKDKTEHDLLIAGSGILKDVSELQKIINKLKLGNKVKLLGKVTGKDKEKLLSECKFVVIPSRFETFSIVALEALSFGLPTVTFDIDGLNWMPINSRIKVKPFDHELLAKSILYLDQNPKMQNNMRKIGLNYAKKYTWNKISGQYSKYLKSLL